MSTGPQPMGVQQTQARSNAIAQARELARLFALTPQDIFSPAPRKRAPSRPK